MTLSRVAVLWLAVVGCGRAPIQDEVDAGVPTHDAGSNNLPDASPAPLKFVVVMNNSPSFSVTDPMGARAASLFPLLDAQPAKSSVFIELFAGSTTSLLMPTGFQRITDLTASDRAQVSQAILKLASGQSGPTDLVMPLQTARAVIEADLAKQPGGKYRVLLITDGSPRAQEQTLLCSDLISSLVSLGDVRLNVAHLNQAAFPSCPAAVSRSTCSVQPMPENCPSAVVLANQTLLHQLADLGHGGFHSFGPNDTVDFSLALAPE